MKDCSWIPAVFKNSLPQDIVCKSDRTPGYNCIAWAVGKTDNPWWPTAQTAGYFWPPHLPRELEGQETLGNFVRAFETEGYRSCENGAAEGGFEKVAIYVDADERPLHAARSVPNGKWSSKLGDFEDIEHVSLKVLEGAQYGKVAAFLKRPTK